MWNCKFNTYVTKALSKITQAIISSPLVPMVEYIATLQNALLKQHMDEA